jgi:protein SCO1
MIRRYGLWIAVGVAAVLFVGLVVWFRAAPAPHPAAATATATASTAIGGPFRLIDQNGRPADETLLKGKWSAVFFGYTDCPDVCPTTLQALAAARQALGDKAQRLQVVFVTVDPERDTPAQLKDYLSNAAFPQGIIGLTGTPKQIADVAAAYDVYYAKQGDGPNYQVNHSSAIYLMNPQGQFDSPLAFGLTPTQMRDQIAAAMNKS